MTRLAFVNIFARDIAALSDFYVRSFGFTVIDAMSTPIHRALETGGTPLGFNAYDGYPLLGLDDHHPATGVRFMLTIDVESRDAVASCTARAVKNGATLIKDPFETYYGWYQSVLLDPEGNTVRVNFVIAP